MNRIVKHIVAATVSWCIVFAIFTSLQPPRVGLQPVVLREPPSPEAIAEEPSEPRWVRPEDKVVSTNTTEGRFVGFEIGDYVHPILRTRKGKTESYWVADDGVAYYLASRKNKVLRVRYQVVDTYISDQGVHRIERIEWASDGNQDSDVWWREMQRRHSAEELEKRFDPMIYADE